MPDAKISDLAAVTDLLATDEYVLARSGATKKITGTSLLDGIGAWTTYTATLTASTTNPTLGVDSVSSGRYLKIGKMVTVRFRIVFGTSGTNAGSGTYAVALPFTNSLDTYTGSITLFDQSTGTFRTGTVEAGASGSSVALIVDSATARVSHAVPWAWTVSDQINGFFMYETS